MVHKGLVTPKKSTDVNVDVGDSKTESVPSIVLYGI